MSTRGGTHPYFKNDTPASIGVEVVQAIFMVLAEVRVGHGLPERDAAPEAALALELDDCLGGSQGL